MISFDTKKSCDVFLEFDILGFTVFFVLAFGIDRNGFEILGCTG